KPPSPQPLEAASLNSNDDCVRGARGVDHGQPYKARAGRIDQAQAPSVDLAARRSVDHDSHRQHSAGDLDGHGGSLTAARSIHVDPAAIKGELDVERLL